VLNNAQLLLEKARNFGIDTQQAEELLNKAKSLINSKNYEEAIKYAEQAEKIVKNTWIEKGNNLIKLKKYEEAIKYFEDILKLYPTFLEAKKAKETAEEIKKKEQNKSINVLNNAQLLLEKARNFGIDTQQAEELLNKAKSLINSKNYEETIK